MTSGNTPKGRPAVESAIEVAGRPATREPGGTEGNAKAARFTNDAAGFNALIAWFDQPVRSVVYEPTGPWHRAFEEALLRAGLPLARANPLQARRPARRPRSRAVSPAGSATSPARSAPAPAGTAPSTGARRCASARASPPTGCHDAAPPAPPPASTARPAGPTPAPRTSRSPPAPHTSNGCSSTPTRTTGARTEPPESSRPANSRR